VNEVGLSQQYSKHIPAFTGPIILFATYKRILESCTSSHVLGTNFVFWMQLFIGAQWMDTVLMIHKSSHDNVKSSLLPTLEGSSM